MLPMIMSLIAAIFVGAQPSHDDASDGRPDIIVIVADDMAPEDLGCYGGSVPTPNIDKLAQSGVLFTKAFATSTMCTPSRYSIMTGYYPSRSQSETFLSDNPLSMPARVTWNTLLGEGTPTIGGMLSELGYDTVFVGKWHIGGDQPEVAGLPQFDFDADPRNEAVDSALRTHQSLLQQTIIEQAGFQRAEAVLWGNFDGHEGAPLRALRWHKMGWFANAAREAIASAGDRPLFLYTAVTTIHGPTHTTSLEEDQALTPAGRIDAAASSLPDAESIRERLVDAGRRYDHRNAAITQFDDFVGTIVEGIQRRGREDNTLVIITADHAVEPGKAGAYGYGARVPFIVHWPVQSQHGTTDALFSLVDLAPTLVAIAGSDADRLELDGLDQSKVLAGAKDALREYAIVEAGYSRSITDGRYSYLALRFPDPLVESMASGELEMAPDHFNYEHPTQTRIVMGAQPGYFDADQFYDLVEDPYEQVNRADDPQIVDQMEGLKQALFAVASTMPHPFPVRAHPFMSTQQYTELVERRRESIAYSVGIDWWDAHPRPWPPVESR